MLYKIPLNTFVLAAGHSQNCTFLEGFRVLFSQQFISTPLRSKHLMRKRFFDATLKKSFYVLYPLLNILSSSKLNYELG